MSSNGYNSSSSPADSDDNSGIKYEDWGFQVDRLFDVAYRFYKRNESKAFHPSFDERNQLMALILQARYGNFDDGKAPDVGVLDLVGKSRRQCWATLKGMSKTEAMSKFICTLNGICPFFKAHVEAVKISCNAQAKVPNDKQKLDTSAGINKDEKLKAIYTSLCRQTYQQFKGYAMKQYPNDVQQQKYLISSLQEQYYQQYVSQMHPELSAASSREQLKSSLSPAASETSSTTNDYGADIPTAPVRTEVDPVPSDQFDTTPGQGSNPDIRQDILQPIETPDGSLKDDSLAPVVADHQPGLANNDIPQETTHNGQNTEQEVRPPDCEQQVLSELPVIIDESYLPKPNPYQPTDLHSIGKFESFPGPKPIPNNILRSSMAPKDDRRERRPAHTAIDLGEESPTKESITGAPTVSSALPPQELPPPPPQELPPPPSMDLGFPAPVQPNVLYQFGCGTQSSDDLTNQPNTGQPQDSATDAAEKEPSLHDGSSIGSQESPLEQDIAHLPLEPANTWTKRGCDEFKESLADDKHGGVYVVKQGTLVTIQVPTYPGGRYIYWEFATGDYDIGFGLDFVYEANLMEPLAVEIFEETDEDCEDDDCDDYDLANHQVAVDTEAAFVKSKDDQQMMKQRRNAEKLARLANTVTIIPTYRRDSHEEIFVGRHRYPGRGYYLLRFDNTYSVLRSKTIFFRICYFI